VGERCGHGIGLRHVPTDRNGRRRATTATTAATTA
jgi:hypothetical protein